MANVIGVVNDIELHHVQVTNDGATILKSIGIDNPAAKVLVDISKVQDDEVGDGTTSVVVLACELLKEAERLISLKIHPQTIIAGFRKVRVSEEIELGWVRFFVDAICIDCVCR